MPPASSGTPEGNVELALPSQRLDAPVAWLQPNEYLSRPERLASRRFREFTCFDQVRQQRPNMPIFRARHWGGNARDPACRAFISGEVAKAVSSSSPPISSVVESAAPVLFGHTAREVHQRFRRIATIEHCRRREAEWTFVKLARRK